MDTRFSELAGRWFLTAGLSLAVALCSCADPGTDVAEEKKKDADSYEASMNLDNITDPGEKAAAEALKAAGADVMVGNGSVLDVGFSQGGCDDAVAANLAKTPNLEGLTLMGCRGVSDKSADVIAKLSKLKMVMLEGTAITAAGVTKIKAGAPNARIMHPATNAAQKAASGGPPSAGAANSGRPPGQP
ncbi:MAG: hypothetical protein QF363_16295 [Planctomycetaceae bacterium]|jgi:hypothetical protein|nr:hypothetical protein [Planctomycetaceae bacterium]